LRSFASSGAARRNDSDRRRIAPGINHDEDPAESVCAERHPSLLIGQLVLDRDRKVIGENGFDVGEIYAMFGRLRRFLAGSNSIRS
jgi:hypothetical protein